MLTAAAVLLTPVLSHPTRRQGNIQSNTPSLPLPSDIASNEPTPVADPVRSQRPFQILQELKSSSMYSPQSQQHVLAGAANSVSEISQLLPASAHNSLKLEASQQHGVVAGLNKGNILMGSTVLDEKVEMEFTFTLAQTMLVSCPQTSTGQEKPSKRLELRSVRWRSRKDTSVHNEEDVQVTVPLVNNLSTQLLARHRGGLPFAAGSTSEGVKVTDTTKITKAGRKYHSSIDIRVRYLEYDDTTSHGSDATVDLADYDSNLMLEKHEWRLIVGLLRSTITTMKNDVLGNEKGFSEFSLSGAFDGVGFVATWKFWEEGRGC